MHTPRRHLWKAFAVAFSSCLLFVSLGMSEEDFPSKPIAVVLGYPGGGMSDTLLRQISKAAETELGQPIVIENKPGAGGVIAISHVLKSKPDGYTLGSMATAGWTVQPQMRDLPYDPFKDMTDIMTYYMYNGGLCVRSDTPWHTIEDVVAYSKKNPGKFRFGHPGLGMLPHLVLENYAMKEGVKWQQVPFKGTLEAVSACLGGHIDGCTGGALELLPQVTAGKLRLLMITSERRWSQAPDVPTIIEKGCDFSMFAYMGIYGPHGIPQATVKKLDKAFKNGMKDPSFQQTLKDFSIEEAYLTGEEYRKRWEALYPKTGEVLKLLGLSKNK